MLSRLRKKIAAVFGNWVRITNVMNSNGSVTIAEHATFRTPFSVSQKWFDELLKVTYDDEIKYKYIPELHQTNVLKDNRWMTLLTSLIGEI